MKAKKSVSIFQRPLWVALFALTAAIAWGFAYPLIKLGYGEFGITPAMTGSKMLFAGIRFTIAGLIVLAMALSTRKDFHVRYYADWWYILLFCLVNTTLHYTFFYIGLSHSEGARAAILNSLSVFSVVIMACVFFKSDRMTLRKVVGCVIGFAGILSLNLGGADSGRFTWLGDGMIILNALCGATASLLTRGLGKRLNVFVGTGYSLAIGGAILVVCGLLSWRHTAESHGLRSTLALPAHLHQHCRLLAIQQAVDLQSHRQGGHIQLADTCRGSRQFLAFAFTKPFIGSMCLQVR